MNRLANETSPYLRQHADNPVDWWPWCPEALTLAQQQDRPILLSIGYAACHWCHVMAHESFEDAETAEVMNARYVNIKVDREERPDIDHVCQLAHQLIARRGGGWPLTLMLDPKTQVPFFAGTYFPPENRHGLPGFRQLLNEVADWYAANRDDVARQSVSLTQALNRLNQSNTNELPDASIVQSGLERLQRSYDHENGGFGTAPKFPQPSIHRFLQRIAGDGEPAAKTMHLNSIDHMINSGLFDPVDGGFFRYCVDAHWEIPHFEKMLYDNAQLLELIAAAEQQSPTLRYREAISGCLRWLKSMQDSSGLLYSSLDADSDGGEGRYYLWQRDELASALGDDWQLFQTRFGITGQPNFEGFWHLCPGQDPWAGTDEDNRRIRDCLLRLAEIRQERSRPGLDDKTLTAWNALAIRALARTARLTDNRDAEDLARSCLAGVRQILFDGETLLASSCRGRPGAPAFLDDHVFLIDALLSLLMLKWDSGLLDLATMLADRIIEKFADEEQGGFYFTSADHDALFHRPRKNADDALPGSSAVAAAVLMRLGWLLGEPRYLDSAERTLRSVSEAMTRQPAGHCDLMTALVDWLQPPPTVVLRGALNDDWLRAVRTATGVGCDVYCIANDVESLPEALSEKPGAKNGEVLAYVCRGMHCEAPLREPGALADIRAV